MTKNTDGPSGWMRDPRMGFAALIVSAAALGISAAPLLNGGGFEQRVRSYLLDNPQLLEEVNRAGAVRQMQQIALDIDRAVAANPALLAHDPRDPALGPAPDEAAVTVVQFFDYRCPACKQISPGYLALIAANTDVRFVFKEWPILDSGGEQTSNLAARAALAANAQGRYLPVHRALMAEPDLTPEAIQRILSENGVDISDASARIASDDAANHVNAITETALALGLYGTPSVLVNGRFADSNNPERLSQMISEARRTARP